MRHRAVRSGMLACLVVAAGLPLGCSTKSKEEASPEAQAAEKALGIDSVKDNKTDQSTTHKVIVEDTKLVRDAETGKVLSEEVSKTPVTVTEEKEVRTGVGVDVGTPQTTPK